MAIAVLIAGVLPSSAHSYTFGWAVSSAGPQETVYDWTIEHCQNSDRPDLNLGAFKYTNGAGQPKVQMNFGITPNNRRLIGDTLNTLKRESTLAKTDPTNYRTGGSGGASNNCAPGTMSDMTYVAPGNSDPSKFERHAWMSPPHLVPGATPTVYTLVHDEYHGENFGTDPSTCGVDPDGPGPQTCVGRIQAPTCPSQDGANKCWRSAITLVKSDGSETQRPGTASMPNKLGAIYERPSPDYLVASIPYAYSPDWGRHGFNDPSNILKGEDGAYYILANTNQGTTPPPATQDQGTCLLRTTNLAQASSWRAWNGQSFSTTLVNPYTYPFTSTDTPADHRCAYVLPAGSGVPRSFTYNRYLKKYMMVSKRGAAPNPEGQYFYLSDDMFNWSGPHLISHTDFANPPGPECQDHEIDYPVLLDPTDPAQNATGSANPNFDHPGRMPYLYYRRANLMPDCSKFPQPQERDIARQPLKFNLRLAGFESGTAIDSSAEASGFDSTTPGNVGVTTTPVYEGTRSAYAYGYSGQRAYGSVNATWNRSTVDVPDVWYGAAVLVSNGFQGQYPNMPILRWNDPDGASYGGVFQGADGRYHLGLGSSDTPPWQDLAYPFDLAAYENSWVWIDVHQRFDSTNPLNEVFVNGKLVLSTTTPNTNTTNSSISNRVDYGVTSGPSLFSMMYLDRAVVDASQRAPVGAPDVPLGPRQTSSSPVTIAWNPVSPKTAGNSIKYGVYRCDALVDGWVLQDYVSGTSYVDADYSGPAAYRITAVESAPTPSAPTTKESDYTAPLPVGTSTVPVNC